MPEDREGSVSDGRLCTASALDLATRIRSGALSSRELVDACFVRIERLNPELNALVTLDRDTARTRAAEADRALARGEEVGPLHGVPITVKDTFETAGLKTTAGFPPLAEHVPAADAVAVARLREAGAIVLGKSNTPLLAGDWQCHNPLFGVTRNPWDLARTPGGSSGGSAVALAAGLAALEVGSDIAGSIRVPASHCGVYGLKPTHGIVPLRGHIPGPPGSLSEADLAVAGPMARSVDDLECALRLMAGPLPERAAAWRFQLPEPRRERLRDYRVAAWIEDPFAPVDAEVSEVLHGGLEALARSGVRVAAQARPPFSLEQTVDTYLRLFWPLFVAGLPGPTFDGLVRAAETLPEDADDADARRARYATQRHRGWLAANEARQRLRRGLADFFREFDVLLCPVAPVAAIPHDHREPMWERTLRVSGTERPYQDFFSWIGLATVSFAPAVSAPLGRTRSGLPVGLQVVGPYLEDRTPLDFARRLTDVVGGFEPPPLAQIEPPAQ